jgi:RNA polymerase sigma-70 factor (ECF subfamily)
MDRVFRHLRYRLSSIDEAEDLTQQVFLQAFQSIGRYRRTGSPFIAWLLTIAHNLIVDRHRARRESVPLEIDVIDHDRGVDPEWYAQARLDQDVVRKALKRLKPEQQLVISMRFLEHIDYTDIAAAMGKTEGNVRVIQHRGLQALRKILEGE